MTHGVSSGGYMPPGDSRFSINIPIPDYAPSYCSTQPPPALEDIAAGREQEPYIQWIMEFKKAQQYQHDMEYAYAERHYRRALNEHERFNGPRIDAREIVTYLCACLNHQRKYSETVRVVAEWLQPEGEKFYRAKALALRFHLVVALYSQKDMEQARDEFMDWKSAILTCRGKNNKNNTQDLYAIGYTLLNVEASNEAEYILQDMVQTLGEQPDMETDASAWYRCLILLGIVHWRTNRLDEAEQAFRMAIEGLEVPRGGVSWELYHNHLWLVSTLARQSKYQDAKALCESVLSRSRISRTFWNNTTIVKSLQTMMADIEHAMVSSRPTFDQRRLPSSSREECYVVWEHTPLSRPKSVPTVSSSALYRTSGPLERLNSFFDSLRIKFYSYAEVTEIARLLEICSIPWAAKAPRTYIVLRHMQCSDLLERMIVAGFSDYQFPLSEKGLPACLSSDQKQRFNKLQHLVLDPSMDLERAENGAHQMFVNEELVPLKRQKLLGKGAFGEVDRVLSLITYREYARKRVSRQSVFRNKKIIDSMRQLQEEIQILKRLNHHHTVRYMGSYTSPTVLGLIMTPIADLDLAQYLELANASDYVELRTFFGCLATGLDYLHQSMVRHKYIKSRNVRVHNGKVLFADFGLSLDFSEADGDTTVSMVNGMTPRYCAPEVADCLPRRKSADIWSLGVVFLEMTTILTGNDIDFMRNFFLTHGTEVDFVYKNIPGLSDHLAELRKLAPKQVDFPLQWIEGMLQVDPRDRPHAASLVDAILNARGDSGASDFCGMCCTREVEV